MDEELFYRSYRQGGMRYENVIRQGAPALELNFEENIFLPAMPIWDQLQPEAYFSYLDFAKIFGNDSPVNIEIGIGNGEFIAHHALMTPNENWMGFEVFHKVFYKAVSRLRQQKSCNARVIQFDAELFVRLIPDESIKQFYVNFPDPWPKARHNKRRLLKTWFLELMRDKLIPGGKITVATDHDDYAMEIAENFSAVDNLLSEYGTPYSNDPGNYFKTKYFRKFADGETVYLYNYRRA
jgi:tRNA (guanine-N7-)-methyltransferase